MKYLVASPAADRLGWLLDGLSGVEGWGFDAADMLAPELAATMPPARFTELVRLRAAAFAPVAVVGLDVGDETATARVRIRDGSVQVVTCSVEAQPPHRIRRTRTMPLIPEFLTPRLPSDFSGTSLSVGRGEVGSSAADGRTLLVVFSGVPGTGKSTLAEATGRQLGVPVFAVDWLLGSLTPFGGYHFHQLLEMGMEMLTALAFRQLALGQSAILDCPVEDVVTRNRWRTLAQAAGSRLRVVLCTCSDRQLHQTRLEHRGRGIPGWHEGGNWANVERRLAEFMPWTGEVLTVDAVRPLAENLAAVLDYVAR